MVWLYTDMVSVAEDAGFTQKHSELCFFQHTMDAGLRVWAPESVMHMMEQIMGDRCTTSRMCGEWRKRRTSSGIGLEEGVGYPDGQRESADSRFYFRWSGAPLYIRNRRPPGWKKHNHHDCPPPPAAQNSSFSQVMSPTFCQCTISSRSKVFLSPAPSSDHVFRPRARFESSFDRGDQRWQLDTLGREAARYPHGETGMGGSGRYLITPPSENPSREDLRDARASRQHVPSLKIELRGGGRCELPLWMAMRISMV
jgi:hypothetical protein